MDSMEIDLRLLDPATDLHLFEEAYNWRPDRKPHVQPDRMPFEQFSANDPRQIVIGAFNGQLEAVFVFWEFEPKCFEAHFTTRKGIEKDLLYESAREVVACLLENGASQLVAWIIPRNTPLTRFVEGLGFQYVSRETFPCQNDTNGSTLTPDREFNKYVCTR